MLLVLLSSNRNATLTNWKDFSWSCSCGGGCGCSCGGGGGAVSVSVSVHVLAVPLCCFVFVVVVIVVFGVVDFNTRPSPVQPWRSNWQRSRISSVIVIMAAAGGRRFDRTVVVVVSRSSSLRWSSSVAPETTTPASSSRCVAASPSFSGLAVVGRSVVVKKSKHVTSFRVWQLYSVRERFVLRLLLRVRLLVVLLVLVAWPRICCCNSCRITLSVKSKLRMIILYSIYK